MATDKPRFSITLDEPLLKRIDAYQLEHSFSTKSRAIQSLLEIGLNDMVSSGELKKESPSISEEDQELLGIIHTLDAKDQGKVLGYAESLLSSEKYSIKDVSKHA